METQYPDDTQTQINYLLQASRFIRANIQNTELHPPSVPFVRDYITPGQLLLHLYTPNMLPENLKACRDGAIQSLTTQNYSGKVSVIFQFGPNVAMKGNEASTIQVILSVVNQPYMRNLIRLFTYNSPMSYHPQTATGFFRWLASKSLRMEVHELQDPDDLEDHLTRRFKFEA